MGNTERAPATPARVQGTAPQPPAVPRRPVAAAAEPAVLRHAGTARFCGAVAVYLAAEQAVRDAATPAELLARLQAVVDAARRVALAAGARDEDLCLLADYERGSLVIDGGRP